jgi:hypothetical protein
MRLIAMILILILAGCATSESVLAPYASPLSCAEIDAEMVKLAERDANIYTARGLKEGAATGVGIAAASGVIPVGFAWLPLVAAVAGELRLTTHEERIAFLAYAREARGCTQ